MAFLGPLLTFVIVLGIIVLVHECGHYFAARLMKIRVETFSIGFGPAILQRRKKETLFRIGLIPLGGYVKLFGEEESEGAGSAPDSFLAKNRAQKVFTLAMGAAMNIVLAVLVIFLINLGGVETDLYKLQRPEIGHVWKDSPAEKAGLQKGDLVQKINGRQIANWEQLELKVATSPNEKLKLEVARNGKLLQLELAPDKNARFEIGQAGFFAPIPAIIGEVLPDLPAGKAGLKKNDRIVAIDHVRYENYFEINELIRSSPGKELLFTVLRQGREFELRITPRKTEQGFGQVGFQVMLESKFVRYSIGSAFLESLRKNIKMSTLVFDSLKKLITGKLSPKTLSGPIEIARYSHQALESGWSNFFFLIAFISLQLGLINLLPIPALDGGHILILAVESRIRRDLPERLKVVMIYMGFAFLILLMAFVIVNDIAKTLPNGWKSLIPF